MDEEQKQEQSAPPRFRFNFKYKGFKFLTLTLFFVALLSILGFTGLQGASNSKFCSSCHEMKPEYYTWKASTHNEVDCVNCHTDPVLKKLGKEKAEGVIDQIKNQQSDSVLNTGIPIKMPGKVPDSACEKCHNMKTRQVTPSGDLIIPHDKHMKEKVACTECHSGVAHGKIADRKMTYQADYSKWDQKVGDSAMADLKFTRPTMDTCMECHEARKVTVECKACHTTSMVPKNHKTETFKNGGHGKIQPSDLKKCEQCHSYMSTESYDLFKEDSVYAQFLKGDTKTVNVSVSQYAQTNTFCKNCHGKKPESHKISSFMTKHGTLSKNTQKCFTCHQNRNTSDSPVTSVQCASCHPSSHGVTFKTKHPFKLPENQKPEKSCFRCHVETTCNRCHKTK